MAGKRTDLAVEAREIWRESAGETTKLAGVEAREETRGGVKIEWVRVLDGRGEAALGKKRGVYVTFTLNPETALREGAEALARELRAVLVAGLGNRLVTPDSLGPLTLRHIVVTRHLRGEEAFRGLRPVAAIEPGVSGTTGMESAELILAAAGRLRPVAVIAVDALASRRLERVCATVQLADTGITPGSGVGNSRQELSEATLGVPVIAVGVPTVVDAGTLAADIAQEAGVAQEEAEALGRFGGVIVTPRDIDRRTALFAKAVGYAVDLALQRDMSFEDIADFLT